MDGVCAGAGAGGRAVHFMVEAQKLGASAAGGVPVFCDLAIFGARVFQCVLLLVFIRCGSFSVSGQHGAAGLGGGRNHDGIRFFRETKSVPKADVMRCAAVSARDVDVEAVLDVWRRRNVLADND